MIDIQDSLFGGALAETLALAERAGADEAECLEAAGEVTAGDRESWHLAWLGLAARTRRAAIGELAEGRTETAGAALLRAAVYYRAASMFLDESGADPRHRTTMAAGHACYKTTARLNGLAGPAGEQLDLLTRVYAEWMDGTEGTARAVVSGAPLRGEQFSGPSAETKQDGKGNHEDE